MNGEDYAEELGLGVINTWCMIFIFIFILAYVYLSLNQGTEEGMERTLPQLPKAIQEQVKKLIVCKHGNNKYQCKSGCAIRELRDLIFSQPRRETAGMTLEERSRRLLDELFNERNNVNVELMLRSEIDELLGIPPLLVVSSFGHVVGLRALLSAGADVNTRNKSDGCTALIHAVKCGNSAVIQELLDHDADPSIEDNEGMNALMVAVLKGDSSPVNLLWQCCHKVDINRSNKNGATMLMIAAQRNWESCVNMLISGGADKHKQSNDGSTALMLAAIHEDHIKTVERLVAAGTNLLQEDYIGRTAICRAILSMAAKRPMGGNMKIGKETKASDYLMSKLTYAMKEKYISRRVQLIKNLPKTFKRAPEDYYCNTLFPVLACLTESYTNKDNFYRHKLISELVCVINNFISYEEVCESACFMMCALMNDPVAEPTELNRGVQCRFVQQFVQCQGPEACLKILDVFVSSGKWGDSSALGAFLTITFASEIPEGLKWLRKNYYLLAPHVTKFEEIVRIAPLTDNETKDIEVIWERFRYVFNRIAKERSEVVCKELLAMETSKRKKKKKKKKKDKTKQDDIEQTISGDQAPHFDTKHEGAFREPEFLSVTQNHLGISEIVATLCRDVDMQSHRNNRSAIFDDTTTIVTTILADEDRELDDDGTKMFVGSHAALNPPTIARPVSSRDRHTYDSERVNTRPQLWTDAQYEESTESTSTNDNTKEGTVEKITTMFQADGATASPKMTDIDDGCEWDCELRETTCVDQDLDSEINRAHNNGGGGFMKMLCSIKDFFKGEKAPKEVPKLKAHASGKSTERLQTGSELMAVKKTEKSKTASKGKHPEESDEICKSSEQEDLLVVSTPREKQQEKKVEDKTEKQEPKKTEVKAEIVKTKASTETKTPERVEGASKIPQLVRKEPYTKERLEEPEWKKEVKAYSAKVAMRSKPEVSAESNALQNQSGRRDLPQGNSQNEVVAKETNKLPEWKKEVKAYSAKVAMRNKPEMSAESNTFQNHSGRQDLSQGKNQSEVVGNKAPLQRPTYGMAYNMQRRYMGPQLPYAFGHRPLGLSKDVDEKHQNVRVPNNLNETGGNVKHSQPANPMSEVSKDSPAHLQDTKNTTQRKWVYREPTEAGAATQKADSQVLAPKVDTKQKRVDKPPQSRIPLPDKRNSNQKVTSEVKEANVAPVSETKEELAQTTADSDKLQNRKILKAARRLKRDENGEILERIERENPIAAHTLQQLDYRSKAILDVDDGPEVDDFDDFVVWDETVLESQQKAEAKESSTSNTTDSSEKSWLEDYQPSRARLPSKNTLLMLKKMDKREKRRIKKENQKMKKQMLKILELSETELKPTEEESTEVKPHNEKQTDADAKDKTVAEKSVTATPGGEPMPKVLLHNSKASAGIDENGQGKKSSADVSSKLYAVQGVDDLSKSGFVFDGYKRWYLTGDYEYKYVRPSRQQRRRAMKYDPKNYVFDYKDPHPRVTYDTRDTPINLADASLSTADDNSKTGRLSPSASKMCKRRAEQKQKSYLDGEASSKPEADTRIAGVCMEDLQQLREEKAVAPLKQKYGGGNTKKKDKKGKKKGRNKFLEVAGLSTPIGKVEQGTKASGDGSSKTKLSFSMDESSVIMYNPDIPITHMEGEIMGLQAASELGILSDSDENRTNLYTEQISSEAECYPRITQAPLPENTVLYADFLKDLPQSTPTKEAKELCKENKGDVSGLLSPVMPNKCEVRAECPAPNNNHNEFPPLADKASFDSTANKNEKVKVENNQGFETVNGRKKTSRKTKVTNKPQLKKSASQNEFSSTGARKQLAFDEVDSSDRKPTTAKCSVDHRTVDNAPTRIKEKVDKGTMCDKIQHPVPKIKTGKCKMVADDSLTLGSIAATLKQEPKGPEDSTQKIPTQAHGAVAKVPSLKTITLARTKEMEKAIPPKPETPTYQVPPLMSLALTHQYNKQNPVREQTQTNVLPAPLARTNFWQQIENNYTNNDNITLNLDTGSTPPSVPTATEVDTNANERETYENQTQIEEDNPSNGNADEEKILNVFKSENIDDSNLKVEAATVDFTPNIFADNLDKYNKDKIVNDKCGIELNPATLDQRSASPLTFDDGMDKSNTDIDLAYDSNVIISNAKQEEFETFPSEESDTYVTDPANDGKETNNQNVFPSFHGPDVVTNVLRAQFGQFTDDNYGSLVWGKQRHQPSVLKSRIFHDLGIGPVQNPPIDDSMQQRQQDYFTSILRGCRDYPQHQPAQHTSLPVFQTLRNSFLNQEKPKQQGLTQAPVKPESKSDAVIVTSCLPWTRKSLRWADKLNFLVNLPNESVQRVGNMVFCENEDKLFITNRDSTSSVMIGLLDDGTEVAVKKMPVTNHTSLANTMKSLMGSQMEHSYILKYRGFAVLNKFAYIASDLCDWTLDQHIDNIRREKRFNESTVQRLVWQLLKGLEHLHNKCHMAHMFLMPKRVLIDVFGKVQLSGFGILRPQPVRQLGTEGSPEKWVESQGAWHPTECQSAINGMLVYSNYTIKSDVQVAGMLTHYILSGGLHPFGANFVDIQLNITRCWPQWVFLGHEAQELVRTLLMSSPENRISMSKALNHPYFWPDSKRNEFLQAVGHEIDLEILYRGPTFPELNDRLNNAAFNAIKKDWLSAIDTGLLSDLRSFGVFQNNMADLLRFICSCKIHADNLTPTSKSILKDGCYFIRTFPALLIAVFRVIDHMPTWKTKPALFALLN